MDKTLHIRKRMSTQMGRELLEPVGNDEAFKHFSGGNIAIIPKRLDELKEVAAIHGWEVEVR